MILGRYLVVSTHWVSEEKSEQGWAFWKNVMPIEVCIVFFEIPTLSRCKTMLCKDSLLQILSLVFMKCGVHCTILNEYYCLQYTLGKKWCVFNVCTSRKMSCDIRIQIKEKSPKFSLFVEVLRDRVACPMTEHHLWPNILLLSSSSLLHFDRFKTSREL